MSPCYETHLYRRLRKHLDSVAVIDCHEHLPRPGPQYLGNEPHIGRFFTHYASCDLISVGMPPADLARARGSTPELTPRERWRLIRPWYEKTRNTAYFEALRIALRDLHGVEDFADSTVDRLTDSIRRQVGPGFTRQVFDKAGIDFAMNNDWGPRPVYNADIDTACFVPDMLDQFTGFDIAALQKDTGQDILCLDNYLRVIDSYFQRCGHVAGAFKVGRAYDRPLLWEDVPRSAVEKTFNRLLAMNDRPDRAEIRALEDFVMHYLCRKCGESGLRMKFHTGFQEGNGNILRNSRAGLLANLFLKYPNTRFDIYHISYPYHEEAAILAKNFPNVTIDFCFNWVLGQAPTRRALADMLDIVPAAKIHGFGADYLFVEGSYGHAAIARREITRVLAEKVEEGRFTEDYAARVGTMILRDNPLANFDLAKRRKAFLQLAATVSARKRRKTHHG